jgi:polar amino acid transport system permease protein
MGRIRPDLNVGWASLKHFHRQTSRAFGLNYVFDYGKVLGDSYGPLFIQAVFTTLYMAVIATFLALLFGAILTTIRAMNVTPATFVVKIYVEYHRNVPFLVQLMMWYFAIPQALPRSLNSYINSFNGESVFAIIALSLYSAAYMSEDMRSGLRAIPAGQYEAARSIGLNHVGAMRYVILPQAIRLSVPTLVSQILILFKTTSLASAIGVAELTYTAREIETQTFRVFEAFSIATVIYLIGSFSIMALGAYVSRKTQLRRR